MEVWISFVKMNYISSSEDIKNGSDDYGLEILGDGEPIYVMGLCKEELLDITKDNILDFLIEFGHNNIVEEINNEGKFRFNEEDILLKSEEELYPLLNEERSKIIDKKEKVLTLHLNNGNIIGKRIVPSTYIDEYNGNFEEVHNYRNGLTLWKNLNEESDYIVVRFDLDDYDEIVYPVDITDKDITDIKNLWKREGYFGYFSPLDEYIEDCNNFDDEDLDDDSLDLEIERSYWSLK